MMPGSIRIARVAGIDVYIHVTFFLFLAYFAFAGWQAGREAGMVFSTLAVVLLFACVLLHEFGHAFAARIYGIATPDITLLPIGGIARIERMPEKPTEEIVIALAGPLVNVVIALVLGSVLSLSGELQPRLLPLALTWQFQYFTDIPTAIMHLLFLNNIILVVFNMIPAFPMDGGRVLRALLAMTLPIERATNLAAGVGKTLAIGFAIIGLFISPMLILLAVFIYLGAQQEARSVEVRSMTRGVGIRDVMITNFKSLSRHATLHEAIDALLSSYQHDFPVVDAEGGLLGIITRKEMLGAVRQSGFGVAAFDIMRKDLEPVALNMGLEEAMQKFDQFDTSALPVTDQFGRVIGILTPENVSEMMMVREAMKAGKQGPTGSWRPAA